MTAQILHLRDYKRPEERQAEIDRLGLRIVEEVLEGAYLPPNFPYRAPDEGDCG